MTQQDNQPNLFELSGDGVQITYSTTSFDGKPHFDFQGPYGSQESLTFIGSDISTQQSVLGTLVSVSLVRTIDAGNTVLTLLLPYVRLAGQEAQSFETLAIITKTYGIL
ncbi:MAG TPA: hypothetical protein VIY29_19370, partial [Ktedonobacteraceae bacterium]